MEPTIGFVNHGTTATILILHAASPKTYLLTTAALQKLLAAADTTGTALYQSNLCTYKLLRYGIAVQIAAGKPFETVHLIEWAPAKCEANDFALAEEVTLKGGHKRRPDTNDQRQLLFAEIL